MLIIKIVFSAKYSPSLGKTMIYQQSFYIFQGNNGGYFKFAEDLRIEARRR